MLITLLGGAIGMILTFGACFMWTLYKGLPLTLENLMVRGKRVLGKLSKKNEEENREVLRNLSLLLKEQQKNPLVVALVLGKKKDYSPSFAQLLEKEGKKVLLIDLDFSKDQKEDRSGLLHYLEGKTNQISPKQKPYGAFISMGGHSPFGYEMVKTKRFQDFILQVKCQYDILLLALAGTAKSSLPKSLLPYSNVMIIRLAQESYIELIPYFNWEGGQLAFLS